MNWTAQKQLDYLKSLEKKSELTSDDITLLSKLSKVEASDILSKDEEISIKCELASQLVRFESDFCRNILLNLTNDNVALVRVEACDSLCVYRDREVFNRLFELSTEDEFLVRGYAVMSMADVAANGKFDFKEVIQLLKNNVSKEKSIYVKMCYYYAFCVMGEHKYYDIILQHLSHKFYYIRLFSISLLLELIREDDYDKTLQCFIQCKKSEKVKDVQQTLSRAIDQIMALSH